MKEEPLSEGLLREFLLGNVSDEERQRIESLFLTDQLAKERVLAAEEGLIDDYLDGSLTKTELEQFLRQYAETPAQQQKLKLARLIREWATAQHVSPAKPAVVSAKSSWRERLWLKPAFVVPIAATVLIAIAVSVVWRNSRVEQRNRRLAIQEKVVKLNDPSGFTDVPPQASLELKPGVLRSGETEAELVIGPETTAAELRFLVRQEPRYDRYRAVVRRIGNKNPVTTIDLSPEADGKTIRLRLPKDLLTRGDYQVELGGVNADGTLGPTEEYRFKVRG